MKENFYSNGKLLITGEYAVLDGAKAFAIPTKYGQSLVISKNDSGTIEWTSFDNEQNSWFKAIVSIPDLNVLFTTNEEIANTLSKILEAARNLNSDFLITDTGLEIATHLGFPKDWGLGSSSTLINNIANWAEIDPYSLLEQTFGGSGYDLACAANNKPIVYQLINDKATVEKVDFKVPFSDKLFFVYLDKKQNSRDAIKNYRAQSFDKDILIDSISTITEKTIKSQSLIEFELLIKEHEALLSNVLKIKTVQENFFSDYTYGVVKSLGGWGGDFVLATGTKKTPEYFKSKGFNIVIPYQEMIY
ncbi:GYDIA family GHMP kinase [Croceitalea vernalis]|uniref:GYDIA family GHMP kinase n=1 Tax=Croceitalea vernalis TaxID=3075599 RepID=A0ABU3BC31_9FLAO|nr:GYDIA family GHMP kinase [Croceitalea sp. P007]MDT0620032.1 GYDIA family GHMP kinase [Croceitalea sp. P007]